MEELKKILEELAEEVGKGIKKDYEFKDKEESKEAKQKVIDSLKGAEKSIVYCGDGKTLLYGNVVPILASFCCILQNLKEEVPEEMLKDCINAVMKGKI